jgi:hypothetical protein
MTTILELYDAVRTALADRDTYQEGLALLGFGLAAFVICAILATAPV